MRYCIGFYIFQEHTFFFCSLLKNVSTKFSCGVQDCIDCIANVSSIDNEMSKRNFALVKQSYNHDCRNLRKAWWRNVKA